MFHFVIPGQVQSTNDLLDKRRMLLKNVKGTYRPDLYSMTKKAQEQIIALRARAARIPRQTAPCRVSVLVLESGRRDPDAGFLWASKMVLDALVKAGVLEDDSWKHLLGVHLHSLVLKEDPGAVVAISEREPTVAELLELYTQGRNR